MSYIVRLTREIPMAATAFVRARIDETLKDEAAAVLAELGLTVSDVVRMTLTRVAKDHALPFELKVPNAKTPATGPRAVTFLGIAGDEQADLSVHGGPDKAIHHYPRDHYAFWDDALGGHALLASPGAFGENISTSGLVEDAACIGDRYRLGSALVEVSQGRKPCWKLGHRFGLATVPATVVRTRRSGWYYRVLEE